MTKITHNDVDSDGDEVEDDYDDHRCQTFR